jgi:hypothetical protein
MYVVNQERSKIGVMYGPSKTQAGGGEALKYYASCRLALAARKKIVQKKTKVVIGVNLTVRNEKNRTHRPFLSTEGIQIYFDGGINPVGGLLTILIGAGRVEMSGKGTYKVCEPWAGGNTVTFKASKVRNDVPISLLMDCPALVDATSTEEVKEYLSHFESALQISNGDSIEEEPTDQEDILNAVIGHKDEDDE